MAIQIHIFSVGGTIDKIYFDKKSEYEVGPPRIGDILEEAGVNFQYAVESVFRKDSLDITESDRRLLADRIIASPHFRILLTHGTDTMVETASYLSGIQEKTIVLTGAIEPAMSKTSDAAFNVGCAVAAVQVLPPGVYIAMNGCIFDPGNVVKNVAQNRFEPIS